MPPLPPKRRPPRSPGLRSRSLLLPFVVGLAIAGIQRSSAAAEVSESVRIVSYNLNNYLDPALALKEDKSGEARRACIAVLRELDADIVVLLEVGGETVLEEIRLALNGEGRDYVFQSVVQGHDRIRRIGLLARLVPASVEHVTGATYNLGGKTVPVQRGFANCEFAWPNGYRLRLVAAHLKSKRFNPLGQTDMRRYEARHLRYLVDEYINNDAACNLLLVGDFNDSPNSSPLNTLYSRRRNAGGQLFDLRPLDEHGLAWTHFWDDEDLYSRIDYALVSRALIPEIDGKQTHIPDFAGMRLASDHRPLLITLRLRDAEHAPAHDALFHRNIRIEAEVAK